MERVDAMMGGCDGARCGCSIDIASAVMVDPSSLSRFYAREPVSDYNRREQSRESPGI